MPTDTATGPSQDPPADRDAPTEARSAAPRGAADRFDRSERALTPVAGVLLLAITVVLAGGVVTATIDAPPEPGPTTALSLSATDDRITVTHRGGDALDVTELEVRVRVDGEPLARQPPVPFFSAAGFHPGPTGAFNAATDGHWRVGRSASLRVADTNEPTLDPGRTVTVDISVDGLPVATLETVVKPE